MYGVEFREASNVLICGHAEFEIRKHTGNAYYRIVFGPNGMRLDKLSYTEGGWETITNRADPGNIEAILPRGDFGLEWTFSQFMLALTFFAEGHKLGYIQGEWKGRELERNRQRAQAAREQDGDL